MLSTLYPPFLHFSGIIAFFLLPSTNFADVITSYAPGNTVWTNGSNWNLFFSYIFQKILINFFCPIQHLNIRYYYSCCHIHLYILYNYILHHFFHQFFCCVLLFHFLLWFDNPIKSLSST